MNSDKCFATQYSDQMECMPCGLRWDVNDPAPPKCWHGIPNFKFTVVSAGATPADLLRDAAALFEERNADYGNNYERMGAILMAIFPDGIPAIITVEDANRLNLMIDCLGKLSRYAHNFSRGGHLDSVRDLVVYAAMLESKTDA